MRRAVFIDRDGTINVNVEYLDNPEEFEMYPGVAEGIKLLNTRGFFVVVATNQSGIERGYYTQEIVEAIHARMKKELWEKAKAWVDAIYYCPHAPETGCECRKPKPGLLQKAIREHDIIPRISFMVGDRPLDVEAGEQVGAITVLVPEKGKEESVARELKESWAVPDYITDSFYDACLWILSQG
ncbi:MAG: HAD family hydrolase [Thermoplasmata archaeon]|nr:HAD family hydrolase [Thermoplasmata archaeon]